MLEQASKRRDLDTIPLLPCMIACLSDLIGRIVRNYVPKYTRAEDNAKDLRREISAGKLEVTKTRANMIDILM